ncbi:MAG: glycine cleavage system protein GcvH [Actinobacteria bacterium]|nr:glycine cleavage system protein GcvH [Actinomycetota bacterium]
MIKYTETYEYIIVDGNVGTVGISGEASDKLGEIYLVELPEIGKSFAKGQEAAVIESVKSAADVYCPVGGNVIEINSALETKPELVSNSPLEDGWLFKIEIADTSELAELMDREEFKKHLNEES